MDPKTNPDGPERAQVVLVTGAAGGLGRAVARVFAQRGASLALTDHDDGRLRALAAELGLPKERLFLRVADVTRPADVEALCLEAAAALGRIDVGIAIAGGFRMGPVADTCTEDWDLLMDLNARSVFNLARGLVPRMKAQGRGCILTIGSRAALQGGASVGAYAASKAAVLRLTETLAAELLPHGIRVNCVLPSTIDTPTNRKDMPDADFAKWVAPESLAEVLWFLASQAARDISGAAIPVYGRS